MLGDLVLDVVALALAPLVRPRRRPPEMPLRGQAAREPLGDKLVDPPGVPAEPVASLRASEALLEPTAPRQQSRSRKRPAVHPKVCPTCGERFAAYNARQVHCSGACKTRAYVRRLKLRHAKVAASGSEIEPKVAVEPEPAATGIERTCQCGTAFSVEKASSRRKWCSIRCRAKLWHRQKLAKRGKKVPKPRVCAECDQRFSPTGTRQRFCSTRCRNKAKAKRLKAQAVEAAPSAPAIQISSTLMCSPAMPGPRCELCFVAVPAGERYCSTDCQRIADGISPAATRYKLEQGVDLA
jgi:predicted nucleic acid-binding Zn ribbon protein